MKDPVATRVSDDEAPTDYSVVELSLDELRSLDLDTLTTVQKRALLRQMRRTLRKRKKAEQRNAELRDKLRAIRQVESSVLFFFKYPSEIHDVSYGKPLVNPFMSMAASMATRKQIYEASRIGRWDEYGPLLRLEDFSPLWGETQYIPGSSYCTSVSDVALRVSGLLLSVIAAMGIDGRFSVMVPDSHLDSNITIVERLTGRAVGIIKAAMPGKSDAVFGRFENGRLQNENERSIVAGQMYEKLSSLQTTGSRTPFALLTNWNEWQFVSIENLLLAEPDSSEVSLPDISIPVPTTRRWSVRKCAQRVVAKFKPFPNLIFVSDIVRLRDGLKLGKFLEHVIGLMIQTSGKGMN
jgi:hypothetical protein